MLCCRPKKEKEKNPTTNPNPTTTNPQPPTHPVYSFPSAPPPHLRALHPPFTFTTQEAYDDLGRYIVRYLYWVLEAECGLGMRRLEGGSFAFCSDGCDREDGTVLVLVHGSGAVRAGMWARQLVINDTLRSGSVLEYVHEAQARGWGVVVANTNDNETEGRGGAAERHLEEVLRRFALPARRRLVVAHSYGGAALVHVLYEGALKRSGSWEVAFTDSAHRTKAQLPGRARNWVRSDRPAGAPEHRPDAGCPCVSAGHPEHIWTSASACAMIFRWFEEDDGSSI